MNVEDGKEAETQEFLNRIVLWCLKYILSCEYFFFLCIILIVVPMKGEAMNLKDISDGS